MAQDSFPASLSFSALESRQRRINSKNSSKDDVLKRAIDLKPRLKAEVAEAAACLLSLSTSIPAVSS